MIGVAPLPSRTLRVSALAGGRGERWLFADLDFVVPPGRILLLRGPNGAGKTSLLMTLATIVRPFGGTIEIEGRDPEQPIGAEIGLFGHRPAIKPRLSVGENLRFWTELYGGDVGAVGDGLDLVGLGPIGALDAGYLSAGQTRRLALARLVLSNRPVWLLDEPTSALDKQGESLVGALIDRHLDRGGLAVSATHQDLLLRDPGRVDTLQLGETA